MMNDDVMTTEYQDDKTEVAGTVERIIFQNEENGYTVCEILSAEDELVTVVGEMPF